MKAPPEDYEYAETASGGARKGKQGWGAAGKVIVFGIVKRNGIVKAQPIPVHDRTSIMSVVQAESQPIRFRASCAGKSPDETHESAPYAYPFSITVM
ncbi:hypothetical protein SHLA_63c000360 [Shinella sp. DD12]|nr:hypothetical protein SHLA_63c000360 [Shinella sp. DD12]